MKKRPNRRKLAHFLGQQKLDAVTRTPAILYFPPEVLVRLNALCVELDCSPLELIREAFKPQRDRWEEFVEEVMTPIKPWETEVWPDDPMYTLACVTMTQIMRNLIRITEDPVGFEEQRKHAPPQWAFRSIEEQHEDDQADWWKQPE
jgi:hypothetical protein